jgi:hypothetical protein
MFPKPTADPAAARININREDHITLVDEDWVTISSILIALIDCHRFGFRPQVA